MLFFFLFLYKISSLRNRRMTNFLNPNEVGMVMFVVTVINAYGIRKFSYETPQQLFSSITGTGGNI